MHYDILCVSDNTECVYLVVCCYFLKVGGFSLLSSVCRVSKADMISSSHQQVPKTDFFATHTRASVQT